MPVFYKARNKFHKWRFNRLCRGILETPPTAPGRDGMTLLSMVCHADVIMYLVAAKTFLRKTGMGRALIVDDGTLTTEDKEILKRHIVPLEIIPISSVQRGPCPAGGAWERLLAVADAARSDYVVQLDSDTLTLADIPEVVGAVRENRSFILGTFSGRSVEPIAKTVEMMRNSPSTHVQADAERAFPSLKGYPDLRYCRGCAGFSGFAKGQDYRERIYDFSEQMRTRLGSRWKEWGSEQVTSNFILANTEGAMVLPYPAFSDFQPRKNISGLSFLHFIGTHRWAEGGYARAARQQIRLLAKGAA